MIAITTRSSINVNRTFFSEEKKVGKEKSDVAPAPLGLVGRFFEKSLAKIPAGSRDVGDVGKGVESLPGDWNVTHMPLPGSGTLPLHVKFFISIFHFLPFLDEFR